MRIVISAIQVPFITGGADAHLKGLFHGLKSMGHQVEIVTAPFKFFPESEIDKLMDFWVNQDFTHFSGYEVDKVIALQFPAYYVNHWNKTVWIMHQHRAVYDLYDDKSASTELRKLREKIIEYDTQRLSSSKKLFANSQNVANRLREFNGLDSTPLYHPPHGEERFYCEEPFNYVFYPSRLETHKRQDLLIRAMKCTKTPLKAMIAGVGGQAPRYQKLIETLGLQDKVKMIGFINEQEKYTLYARALAVFFGPYDEDYGYVTLEAMLSSKPVITCTDSGGPLEFVQDGETGFVAEAIPEMIGQTLDFLYHNRHKAREMGRASLESYKKKNINWANVVHKLLDD